MKGSYEELYRQLEQLIQIIKLIGFQYIGLETPNLIFKYDNWVIFIQNEHWELRYSILNDGTGASHINIPFNDRKILTKYFNTQLREIKLNELGI